MTIGAVALDTGTLIVLVTPPEVVVTTVTVSRALAPTGTGSNPPAFIAAVTKDPVAGLNALAVSPSSTVPGGIARYVTLSSAALLDCATPGARGASDPRAASGIGFGARSDTSIPFEPGCSGPRTSRTATPVVAPLEAVIVSRPESTAVTSPALETVATDGSRVTHVTGPSINVWPFPSSSVALSCNVPFDGMPVESGDTVTFARVGDQTVTNAVPLMPVTIAVIASRPRTSPVTSPADETAATAGVLLLHVTAPTRSSFPLASHAVALSCADWPVRIVSVSGEILRTAGMYRTLSGLVQPPNQLSRKTIATVTTAQRLRPRMLPPPIEREPRPIERIGGRRIA